jgi:hypothetical protein
VDEAAEAVATADLSRRRFLPLLIEFGRPQFERAMCGVPKLASCLQIGDFLGRAPNFGTPHVSPVAALRRDLHDRATLVRPVDVRQQLRLRESTLV